MAENYVKSGYVKSGYMESLCNELEYVSSGYISDGYVEIIGKYIESGYVSKGYIKEICIEELYVETGYVQYGYVASVDESSVVEEDTTDENTTDEDTDENTTDENTTDEDTEEDTEEDTTGEEETNEEVMSSYNKRLLVNLLKNGKFRDINKLILGLYFHDSTASVLIVNNNIVENDGVVATVAGYKTPMKALVIPTRLLRENDSVSAFYRLEISACSEPHSNNFLFVNSLSDSRNNSILSLFFDNTIAYCPIISVADDGVRYGGTAREIERGQTFSDKLEFIVGFDYNKSQKKSNYIMYATYDGRVVLDERIPFRFDNITAIANDQRNDDFGFLKLSIDDYGTDIFKKTCGVKQNLLFTNSSDSAVSAYGNDSHVHVSFNTAYSDSGYDADILLNGELYEQSFNSAVLSIFDADTSMIIGMKTYHFNAEEYDYSEDSLREFFEIAKSVSGAYIVVQTFGQECDELTENIGAIASSIFDQWDLFPAGSAIGSITYVENGKYIRSSQNSGSTVRYSIGAMNGDFSNSGQAGRGSFVFSRGTGYSTYLAVNQGVRMKGAASKLGDEFFISARFIINSLYVGDSGEMFDSIIGRIGKGFRFGIGLDEKLFFIFTGIDGSEKRISSSVKFFEFMDDMIITHYYTFGYNQKTKKLSIYHNSMLVDEIIVSDAPNKLDFESDSDINFGNYNGESNDKHAVFNMSSFATYGRKPSVAEMFEHMRESVYASGHIDYAVFDSSELLYSTEECFVNFRVGGQEAVNLQAHSLTNEAL